MSDYTVNGQRWIWDLYPLNPKAWVYRLHPSPEMAGKVIRYLYWGSEKGTTKTGTHQFYMPTDSDLDLLKQLYPNDEPVNPNWHRIAADLVAAGSDAAMLNQSSAPVLLTLLGKPRRQRQHATRDSDGQGEDDYKTPHWFEKNTTISGDLLRKAVSEGKFLPTVGKKARKRYSLSAAKTLWGNDIILKREDE